MSSSQIQSIEDRIAALESKAGQPAGRPQAGAEHVDPTALSVQAFLQGALAAAAATRAEPQTGEEQQLGAAFASIFGCTPEPTPGDTGETAVRAFWWGFHVQLSHPDLTTILDSADVINDTVALIGGNIPSPAQPWIKLIAPFVSMTHDALRGLDRGRGIYISMSWVTPGIFIPTPV